MNFNIDGIILSSLIFCPLVGAILLAILPRRVAREGAVVVGIINFIFSLHLWANWERAASQSGYRFEQQIAGPLQEQLGMSFHLGVDGISLWLILLTTFVTPLAILLGWNEIKNRESAFVINILLLSSAAIGVFCALDVILFYVFYEAVLIPTYLLIVGWGGVERAKAAIKFFLYTMAGSVFMWIALLYLYFQQDPATRSFEISEFIRVAQALDGSTPNIALWLFAAFAVAFAIKVPLFPLHTWQPAAYDQSPTAATIMLGAILSKMGVYGFLRFAIPFLPGAATAAAPVMVALAIIGIIYGALVAMRQNEIKRVFAYSSISHLGVIVLGVFVALLAQTDITKTGAQIALSGATIQMVAHGISTAALFGVTGVLWARRGTLALDQFGGVAASMPRFTVLFWTAVFASIGLPGLCNFVGEYLILQGAMAANFWYAALAATGVIWGAIYMLRVVRETMFGEITLEENRALPDVGARETFALAALLLVAVWIGIAPQAMLQKINPDTQKVAAMTQQAGSTPVPEVARLGTRP
jgi:NADH-quinone oxidoreductase subunit M